MTRRRCLNHAARGRELVARGGDLLEYKESERHSMMMRRCLNHALLSLEYNEPERHSTTMRRSE